MTHKEFLVSQNQTRDQIKEQWDKVLSRGIEPDPALVERRGGFYVSLIHPTSIAQKARLLSKEVSKRAPAVKYSSLDIHTTLGSCVWRNGPHFYCDPHSDHEGASFLRTLRDVVEESVEDIPRDACVIDYTEYILTPHVLIAVGNPNDVFVQMINSLIKEGEKRGIEINPPWGAHITLNRFTEKRSVREMSPSLSPIVAKAEPLGQSKPIGVATGYTLRQPRERHYNNLLDTPGHFTAHNVFLFRN